MANYKFVEPHDIMTDCDIRDVICHRNNYGCTECPFDPYDCAPDHRVIRELIEGGIIKEVKNNE